MSYKDLLKARPADIIPPKPIPPGPFKVRVASHEFGTAGIKKTECVNFSLRLLEPGDEVDPDLLEAARDDLAKAKPNYRVFITEDSLWVLKNFLTDVLKIPEADSLEEMMPQTTGKEFIAIFTQQPSERDKERMVSFIEKVLPL